MSMTGIVAYPLVTTAGLGQGSGNQIPQSVVPCMVRSHDWDPRRGTIDIVLPFPTPDGPGTIHRTDTVTVLEEWLSTEHDWKKFKRNVAGGYWNLQLRTKLSLGEYVASANTSGRSLPYIEMNIHRTTDKALVDSGVTMSVIDDDFRKSHSNLLIVACWKDTFDALFPHGNYYTSGGLCKTLRIHRQ